jgi:hypothetical protein
MRIEGAFSSLLRPGGHKPHGAVHVELGSARALAKLTMQS